MVILAAKICVQRRRQMNSAYGWALVARSPVLVEFSDEAFTEPRGTCYGFTCRLTADQSTCTVRRLVGGTFSLVCQNIRQYSS